MTITTTECEQILKWHDIIKSCKEHCETTWNPQQMTRYCNEAESAFRMFAACYAKHLLKPGFPRQKGYFLTDMDEVLEAIDQFLSSATIANPQPPVSKPKRKHRHRIEDLTDAHLAELYSHMAKPLIKDHDSSGNPIYELKEGKPIIYGKTSVASIKKWLVKYPNANTPHPKNGFHAEMINDKAALRQSLLRHKDHINAYINQFEEWRKHHHSSKRSDFRFKQSKIVHYTEFVDLSKNPIDDLEF